MTSERVDCCIAGAGPAGAMLALLLARQHVSVALLEPQLHFQRDFRGDTLHPSTLETLDEIGLADSLLKLPHSRIQKLMYSFKGERHCISDLTRLTSKYPYIAIIAQAQFLEFIVSIANSYPSFRYIPGARVEGLIEEAGAINGVRYKTVNGREELVRAHLTVGADGRSSRVRTLAKLNLVRVAPSIHVLWFRIPRAVTEPEEARLYFGKGNFMVAQAGHDYWQLGKVVHDHEQVRMAGLQSVREDIVTVAPEFADRVTHLSTWEQISMLSVQPARVRRWYRSGLLLIGDAAHVMSPVGGVGINYGIQDAVAAANLLAKSLKSGEVSVDKLHAVQKRRQWPTKIIQTLQKIDQNQIIDRALDSHDSRVEMMLKVPTRSALLQGLSARLMTIGIQREHVAN